MNIRSILVLLVMVFTPGSIFAAGAPNTLTAMQQQLDTLIDATAVCPRGAPARFVDNGDGTICDHQAGLMWEKKNAADGVQDLTNPQDVDNNYFAPDGTTITEFLDRLNGISAATAASEQLAGYSDWRLPTSAEMQTLLLEPYPCSTSPCIIDPVFNPTSTSFSIPYVTSTYTTSEIKWVIDFTNGHVYPMDDAGVKARAVRGSMGGR